MASAAHAEEGGSAIGRAEVGGALSSYYVSERTTGLLFGGLGVASVGTGTVLVTRSQDFARGLGWSMLSMGVLEILGGGFYALQVNGEITHYGSLLSTDPGAFKTEEAQHIHGTTSRFVFYRVSELVAAGAGVGLAAYGFGADKDTWKGVGIGIAGESLSLFVLDLFGQVRAKAYERDVNRFSPSLAVMPGSREGPWEVSLRGAF